MYCTTCGKQIIDTARFCNYCGTPVPGAYTAPNTAAQTAPAAPVTPTEPITPSTPVSQTESAPVSENIQDDNLLENTDPTAENEPEMLSSDLSETLNEETPSVEPQTAADSESLLESTQTTAYGVVSEPVSNMEAAPVVNVEAPSVPNIEAESAYSLPVPNQIPINGEGDVHVAEVPEKPAKPLPERKYTLGHIMMCLCAVAIMAIVAGVFAGLYFSVV